MTAQHELINKAVQDFMVTHDLKVDDLLKRYSFVYWAYGNSMQDFMELVTSPDWDKQLAFPNLNELVEHLYQTYHEVYELSDNGLKYEVREHLELYSTFWQTEFQDRVNNSMIG